MTAPPPEPTRLRGLRHTDGRPLRVARQPLGTGGQGWVFASLDDRTVAVKLYRPAELRRQGFNLQAKVSWMTRNPPANPTADQGHQSLAWPREMIVDATGAFVGFTMPMLDASVCVPLRQIVRPDARADRHNLLPRWVQDFDDWQRLIHTAANLAAATHSLHIAGYVIGDFNESNILVTDRALVTVIDCDSMQVSTRDHVFLCPVGKDEFTAPELAARGGVPLDHSADEFALAVHCFMLLMGGRHPFRGVWHGPGDRPSELELARRGLYCLSGSGLLTPAAGPPPAQVLPAEVRDMFDRAFGPGAAVSRPRPTALEWSAALRTLASGLLTCPTTSWHHFLRELPACPWCAPDRATVTGPVTGPIPRTPLQTPLQRLPQPPPQGRPQPPPQPRPNPPTFTGPVRPPSIPTYLWQSILTTILCCPPTGAVAVAFASRASELRRRGDIQGAYQASRRARRWCAVSLVAPLVALTAAGIAAAWTGWDVWTRLGWP